MKKPRKRVTTRQVRAMSDLDLVDVIVKHMQATGRTRQTHTKRHLFNTYLCCSGYQPFELVPSVPLKNSGFSHWLRHTSRPTNAD